MVPTVSRNRARAHTRARSPIDYDHEIWNALICSVMYALVFIRVNSWLLSFRPFRAHFFQDRLNGGIGFQESGSQDFAEFASGFSEPVARSPHRRIGHRFLMGRFQFRSLFFTQFGPAGVALHLK